MKFLQFFTACAFIYAVFSLLKQLKLNKRTRRLFNATFFDHVTFFQFKICCCVQNFIEIEWFFAEIWRYIDFQNGGRPPSWNCFTTIRDHLQSPSTGLCRTRHPPTGADYHDTPAVTGGLHPLLDIAPKNRRTKSEDIAIWIFLHIWLEMPNKDPKMGVLREYGQTTR